MALVLDTGVVVALIDADDSHHERCVKLAEATLGDLVLPVTVLPEIDYFLRKRGLLEGWLGLVEDITAGAYRLHSLNEATIARAAELEGQYTDLRLGFVDASVVAACETLGETKVATLDRRHFSVVRPRHCEALTVLPA